MTTNWTAKSPKALLEWLCFVSLFFGSSAVAQLNSVDGYVEDAHGNAFEIFSLKNPLKFNT